MSRQMEAVLMIAKHRVLVGILMPLIDIEEETVRWEDLNYGVLSGGEKAAASWAYCVWTDGPVPVGWRDPFEGFGVMGRDLQATVLRALAHRWSG